MHGEYENMLFDKKQIDPKSKEDNVNLNNWNLNLTKLFYHVLMISNIYLMMELKPYHTDIKILFDWFDCWLIDIFIRHKRYMENVVKSDILMKSDLFDR